MKTNLYKVQLRVLDRSKAACYIGTSMPYCYNYRETGWFDSVSPGDGPYVQTREEAEYYVTDLQEFCTSIGFELRACPVETTTPESKLSLERIGQSHNLTEIGYVRELDTGTAERLCVLTS